MRTHGLPSTTQELLEWEKLRSRCRELAEENGHDVVFTIDDCGAFTGECRLCGAKVLTSKYRGVPILHVSGVDCIDNRGDRQ